SLFADLVSRDNYSLSLHDALPIYLILKRSKTLDHNQIGPMLSKRQIPAGGISADSFLANSVVPIRPIIASTKLTNHTAGPPSRSTYSSCTIQKLMIPMVNNMAYESVGAKRKYK